jgi:hypothetical protein
LNPIPVGTPTDPTPANGATDQPTDMLLSWTYDIPSSGGITFDIYLSSNSVPLLLESDYGFTTIHVSGLDNATTYYWQVVAKNQDGTSRTSALWQFTTFGE